MKTEGIGTELPLLQLGVPMPSPMNEQEPLQLSNYPLKLEIPDDLADIPPYMELGKFKFFYFLNLR